MGATHYNIPSSWPNHSMKSVTLYGLGIGSKFQLIFCLHPSWLVCAREKEKGLKGFAERSAENPFDCISSMEENKRSQNNSFWQMSGAAIRNSLELFVLKIECFDAEGKRRISRHVSKSLWATRWQAALDEVIIPFGEWRGFCFYLRWMIERDRDGRFISTVRIINHRYYQ